MDANCLTVVENISTSLLAGMSSGAQWCDRVLGVARRLVPTTALSPNVIPVTAPSIKYLHAVWAISSCATQNANNWPAVSSSETAGLEIESAAIKMSFFIWKLLIVSVKMHFKSESNFIFLSLLLS